MKKFFFYKKKEKNPLVSYFVKRTYLGINYKRIIEHI